MSRLAAVAIANIEKSKWLKVIGCEARVMSPLGGPIWAVLAKLYMAIVTMRTTIAAIATLGWNKRRAATAGRGAS